MLPPLGLNANDWLDSLVSSHVYEIIRSIYNSPTAEGGDAARVAVLQQTLSQLRLTNIASLDACMNHFTRLIDLTSADEEYISKLATILAPCVLRPRTETSLTMEEKHAYRLIRDLFTHKDSIFNELKRMSTMNSSGTIKGNQNRPRAISTDESNRKAHMEERNRLLLEKAGGGRSRATSPAPSPRASHRRDRSVGGPETRFPISTTLTSPTSEHRKRTSLGPNLPKRTSLEVPAETDANMGLSHPSDGNFIMNGIGSVTAPPTTVADPQLAKVEQESFLEKRNSLGRSGARFSAGRRVTPASAAARTATPPPHHQHTGSAAQEQQQQQSQHGVTLVDAPMDY